MINVTKTHVKRLYNYLKKIKYMLLNCIYTDKNTLRVFWFNTTHNFGDQINQLLLNTITGKKIIWVNPRDCSAENYLVIGSILENANAYSIVWGSGFISAESQCIEKPLKICAVRGPKTRQKLLDSGIECPEVYGDPALLLPKIYLPKIEKKYILGIIPHYVDKNNIWLEKLQNEKNIKILDVQESDPLKFIDDILSCEKIASSSLHGIIVADAYNIPSLWIKFSDKIVGGNFKFFDYFMSVGRKDKEALYINQNTSLDDILNQFYEYEIKIDLKPLLDACPFKCDILENRSLNYVDQGDVLQSGQIE